MNVIDHSLFPLHRIFAKQRLDIKQLLLRLLDANVSVVNIVDMTAVRLVDGNRSSAHVSFILAVNDIIFFKQKIMNLGLQTVTDFNGISGLCIPDDVMMRMHLRHLSDRRGISDQSMRFDADAIIRCTDKAVLNLHKAAARHVDSITGHNT